MNLYMIPFHTKNPNVDNLFCGEVEKLGDWVLCMPNTYIVRTKSYYDIIIQSALVHVNIKQEIIAQKLKNILTNN